MSSIITTKRNRPVTAPTETTTSATARKCARGAPGAVFPLIGFDVDRERRAHRLAQLAGDAALLAVRIAAQRVQPAKAGAHRRLLFGELHRDLARERVAAGEREPAQQLEQHERAEKLDDAIHRRPPVKGVMSRRRMGGRSSRSKTPRAQ